MRWELTNVNSKNGRQVCRPLRPTENDLRLRRPVQLYIQLLVDTHLVEGWPLTRQDRGAVEEFIDKVSILLLKSL